MPLPVLPISEALPRLAAAFAARDTVVLEAPPGAGKTTLAPLFLLSEPWCDDRKIVMLEPRRLAARAAARRMAELLGEKPGETVGYRTRFDAVVSARTRIEVLTEGLLARRLQRDPELLRTALVIFDEFHERHLATDLALALTLDARAALRPDLRVLIMSATLDGALLSRFLDDAPVVSSAGRSFPVEIRLLPRDSDRRIAETAAAGVRGALNDPGDMLVFLPGAGEIRSAIELLRDDEALTDCVLLPLYGDLSREDQDRALRPDPSGRRRIILSTAIAESSLTIEGVRIVVDSGWSRVSVFDPATGMSRLETIRVARDSADQRAGRAGRVGPGVCVRLWSQATDFGLAKKSRPEILAADLAPLALQLAAWSAPDADKLRWLDPPPAAPFVAALALLRNLGALDDQNRITTLGRSMAELPAHSRLARMIRSARDLLAAASLACDIAAILEERDILKGAAAESPDLRERLDALERFRLRRTPNEADAAACRRANESAKLLRRAAGCTPAASDVEPGLLLAFAYPDRIAARRAAGEKRFLLANGCGASLRGHDAFRGDALIVAARLDAGVGEGAIHLAAPVAEESLRRHLPRLFATMSRLHWDDVRAAVVGESEERIGAIVLSVRPTESMDPDAATDAVMEMIRRCGLAALPWTPEISVWRTRVLFLRAQFPEEPWPDLVDATLASTIDAWLRPYLAGARSRRDLERLDLASILRALVPPALARRIDDDAPTHVAVPSGSRIALEYSATEPPVLAVKLQEMFGLAETPRVARGRVPVLLHLLSPARRPIQVTRDLRSFWNGTYAEVKKELRGRYPRHPWPDDPWNAAPTKRTTPRSR